MLIEISGPEHSGKTSLMVVLDNYLRSIGMDITIQLADPQIHDKLDDLEKCIERLKGEKGKIREVTTSK